MKNNTLKPNIIDKNNFDDWCFNPISNYIMLDMQFNVINFNQHFLELINYYANVLNLNEDYVTEFFIRNFNASQIIDSLIYFDSEFPQKTINTISVNEDVYAMIPIKHFFILTYIVVLEDFDKNPQGYLIEFLDIISKEHFYFYQNNLSVLNDNDGG